MDDMSNHLDNVAIIGAGLGGCALALALSEQNVPITVFESRQPDSEVISSGVVLTPNGLRVLDRLGVLQRIQDRCYKTTHRTFKNDKDETIRKSLITNESLYGYANHRIWRKLLLDEMRLMLAERSVEIHFHSKFQAIISDDTTQGVTFRINDQPHSATLLLASDGIHSTVRQYLDPDVRPEYTGVVAVLAHIKRASVAWPSPAAAYERNATIQGQPGALFFIPEDPDAEDIMVGKQVACAGISREGLEELQADKGKLVEFFQRDYEAWGPTARSIIDCVAGEGKGSLYLWPFLKMPTLARWFSGSGRVILVGDGAHALPPSSGQGVNQALEDVYSLTLLLTSLRGEAGADDQRLVGALSSWQRMRQRRIDAVLDWATNATNVQRMPEAEREKLIAEGKIKAGKEGEGDDMAWLYQPNLEEDLEACIQRSR